MASAGDKILIKGMMDGSGVPVGYSETRYPPNINNPEIFPIAIQAGVTVAPYDAASVRFINTFIWNCPGGGFDAEVIKDSGADPGDGPYYLVPLVHCTLAGNGSATTPYTIEILEASGTSGRYEWVEAPRVLQTRLRETIFERQSSLDSDLGVYLRATLGIADAQAGVPAQYVGIAGVRCYPVFPSYGSTDQPSPFQGPINWTSTDPSQFFLTAGGDPMFYQSPTWLTVEAPEAAFDYRGDPRPSVQSGLRDKGAEEL